MEMQGQSERGFELLGFEHKKSEKHERNTTTWSDVVNKR